MMPKQPMEHITQIYESKQYTLQYALKRR